MPTVTMTLEEYEALRSLITSERESEGASLADRELTTKPKRRKKSKYQKELGRQLKMLKKKHPRTKITALMKRAHRATKKALK
ncbi:MAG: hypothetical protein [Circular genetic element sp.]|jgi:hypothetical protein|nr:MAG: hypothetical protein [Circular genetic element sp.]